MTESIKNENNGEQPKPHTPLIVENNKFPKIWLIPIVAVLIGIGMIYNDWRNQGIHIIVQFETAEGLIASKTVLKNRNVDIGLVKQIRFSDDKSIIEVEIEVEKSMASFLSEDSDFWVVKPRFGTTGVTGIGTLLSGAYIEVSPGKSNKRTNNFIGSEVPPVTSSNADGIHLKLMSRGAKTLSVGSPILHKGFKVGAVESKYYDDLDQEAHYDIFIHAPFHNLVTESTSFWNVSGMSMSTTNQGIRIDMPSIDTLLAGGIEFGQISGLKSPIGVPQNHQFQLFDSIDDEDEQRDYRFIEYVVLVEDSVGGLYKGSPVEYRGIRIGTVKDPFLEFIETGNKARIAVVVHLQPERLGKNGLMSNEAFGDMVDGWIMDGMSASIEIANIITGGSKINLHGAGKARGSVEYHRDYPLIPAGQSGLSNIVKKLDSILGTVNELPLQETVSNVNDLIDTSDETFETATTAIRNASQTLTELELSLDEFDEMLKGLQPGSNAYRAVEKMIKKIEVSLDELKPLIDEISNKPNSLIFSKPAGVDKEPQTARDRDQ